MDETEYTVTQCWNLISTATCYVPWCAKMDSWTSDTSSLHAPAFVSPVSRAV